MIYFARTAELIEVVEGVAGEIAEPGLPANFSRAIRKIIYERAVSQPSRQVANVAH